VCPARRQLAAFAGATVGLRENLRVSPLAFSQDFSTRCEIVGHNGMRDFCSQGRCDMGSDFETACIAKLDAFFSVYRQEPAETSLGTLKKCDGTLEERAYKLVRMLRTSDKPLKGKIESWAAGIIYLIATDGHVLCGIPGMLNADFERAMGVNMNEARRRAANIRELVTW
jgi:hypothetical protein